MATNLEVIIGTYEEFLLGYKVELSAKNDDSYSLHQSFAVHAHTGSVRTVHAKGKYLASGGADDRIYVYDMKTRQEIQTLTPHSGIVNHLQFTPDQSHLFSASVDGSFAATRTGSWVTEGFWKAPHGGKPITYISIHPTGKLALTLGGDLTLQTWNLIKGRQIFTTNLKSKPSLSRTVDCVEWGPTGQFFTLTGAKIIELWDIDTAGVVKEVPCDARPTCVCWLDDETQLVGLNNGKIVMFSINDDEPTIFQMYESSRVKGLSYYNGYLASISSAGDVTVWSVDIPKRNITELCAINVGCRPVCVTILDLSNFAKEYVLKMEGADEEEEDNEISDEDAEQSKVEIPKSKKSTGSVVVEVENEDNDKARKVTKQPNLPKKAGKGKGKRNPQNEVSSDGVNGSLLAKKKNNKNNASGFVEEDNTASPPKSSLINKANKRKSVHSVVESGTTSIVKKPKQLNSAKKSQNKLNKTISSLNDGPISSPATRKSKRSRLSLA